MKDADTGYRRTFKNLGFAEAELLVEFGYPAQRFILTKSQSGSANVMMLFMGLYTIVDTIFVARFAGTGI